MTVKELIDLLTEKANDTDVILIGDWCEQYAKPVRLDLGGVLIEGDGFVLIDPSMQE